MKNLVFLAIAVALMTMSTSCFNRGSHSHHDHSSDETHAHLTVSGACEMCKTRIEAAVKGIDGVSSVSYELNAKMLHVDFDASKTSLDAVAKAVAAAGHDNELHRANDAVYESIHECCRYRD